MGDVVSGDRRGKTKEKPSATEAHAEGANAAPAPSEPGAPDGADASGKPVAAAVEVSDAKTEAQDNTKEAGSAAAKASEAVQPAAGEGTRISATEKELINADEQRGDELLDALGGELLAKTYPLTFAASNRWSEEHGDNPPRGLRITSKVDGFRRAGMRHSKEAVEYAFEALPVSVVNQPELLEQLFAEPMLTVELI